MAEVVGIARFSGDEDVAMTGSVMRTPRKLSYESRVPWAAESESGEGGGKNDGKERVMSG